MFVTPTEIFLLVACLMTLGGLFRFYKRYWEMK